MLYLSISGNLSLQCCPLCLHIEETRRRSHSQAVATNMKLKGIYYYVWVQIHNLLVEESLGLPAKLEYFSRFCSCPWVMKMWSFWKEVNINVIFSNWASYQDWLHTDHGASPGHLYRSLRLGIIGIIAILIILTIIITIMNILNIVLPNPDVQVNHGLIEVMRGFLLSKPPGRRMVRSLSSDISELMREKMKKIYSNLL